MKFVIQLMFLKYQHKVDKFDLHIRVGESRNLDRSKHENLISFVPLTVTTVICKHQKMQNI